MKRKTLKSPLPTPPLSEELSRAIVIIEFYEEVLEEQSARMETLAKENERLRELMKDNKPPEGLGSTSASAGPSGSRASPQPIDQLLL